MVILYWNAKFKSTNNIDEYEFGGLVIVAD